MSTPEALELAVFSASGTAVYAFGARRELVVGRGDGVDIRIDDEAVSRRHAVFRAGPPVEIEDLGSANGTFVARAASGDSPRVKTAEQNRARVTRTALAVGDTVSFGGALVVVRRAATARAGAGRAVEDVSPDVVLRDPALVRLYEEAARAAPLALPVLILGETGVGKDVLARYVHRKSPRASKPFVALNCAALSESLAESELFGHEKGAFTGAQQARAGLFEAANGGTVFLDEIGELPAATQAKLLRTLESSEVQRLGSVRPLKVDVRFVSATHRDLEAAVAQGRFRQDLFFRVNGIALTIPPLRARKAEIGELARRFLAAASRQAGRVAPPAISAEALRALEAYSWPGNVRELKYAMERTLVTAGDGPIEPRHFQPAVAAGGGAPFARGAEIATESDDPAAGDEDRASRERVLDALARCDGNQTRAAQMLGVSRRTLINRMIEFGLPRPRKG